jgi:hypothetical protein
MVHHDVSGAITVKIKDADSLHGIDGHLGEQFSARFANFNRTITNVLG